MKPIDKGELYDHLGGFLKQKGIELKDGTYSKRIQQGCALLTDVINVSQSGLDRAKTEAAKTLEKMRQAIHEKTAPKSPPAATASAKPSPGAGHQAKSRKPARRRPASRKRKN